MLARFILQINSIATRVRRLHDSQLCLLPSEMHLRIALLLNRVAAVS